MLRVRRFRHGRSLHLALVPALWLWLAGAVTAQTITAAYYADPTARYDHGVLGDAVEHASLVLKLDTGARLRLTLPAGAVFEDTKPRLADLDGDGRPEVITVESSLTLGARLSVFDTTGRIAATPHIGQRHRWLAPIGAADLDGDGAVEIAYIDRPHLARTLRLWRYRDGTLTPVADLSGLTNHRIGERAISGGIRSCGGGPEMILATGDWSRLVAVSYREGRFSRRELGQDTGPAAFARALACAF